MRDLCVCARTLEEYCLCAFSAVAVVTHSLLSRDFNSIFRLSKRFTCLKILPLPRQISCSTKGNMQQGQFSNQSTLVLVRAGLEPMRARGGVKGLYRHLPPALNFRREWSRRWRRGLDCGHRGWTIQATRTVYAPPFCLIGSAVACQIAMWLLWCFFGKGGWDST